MNRGGSGASAPGTNKSPGNPFVLRKGLKGSLQTKYIFEELDIKSTLTVFGGREES
jgi:hypothetical protein